MKGCSKNITTGKYSILLSPLVCQQQMIPLLLNQFLLVSFFGPNYWIGHGIFIRNFDLMANKPGHKLSVEIFLVFQRHSTIRMGGPGNQNACNFAYEFILKFMRNVCQIACTLANFFLDLACISAAISILLMVQYVILHAF